MSLIVVIPDRPASSTISTTSANTMCLSTPTPNKPNVNADPVAGQSSGGACSLGAMCQDNQLKNRKAPATEAKQTKELDDDNLGYSEENAVYKENAEKTLKLVEEQQQEQKSDSDEIVYKPQIRWPDLGAQTFLHVGALYGLYLLFSAKFYTFLWGMYQTIIYYIHIFGVAYMPQIINICEQANCAPETL